MDLAEERKKLEVLRDSGAMTHEEFLKTWARTVVDEVSARYRSTRKEYESVAALFAADDQAALDADTFAGALWPLLCRRISRVEDAPSVPKPVFHYYASALLEGDVGNGGFAQAAYNYPQWFSPAADGYDAIGYPRSASLLREAVRWLPAERQELQKKGLFRATIGKVFAHFSESRMDTFNDRIVDSEWYVTEARVRYARANRDAFCAIT